MKNIIRTLIIRTMSERHKKVSSRVLDSKLNEQVDKSTIEVTHLLKEIIFLILGVMSASFGLKSFLLPNDFIDGGITGVSLIVHHITNIPVSILLIAINIPFILLGFRAINKSFAIRSIIAISLLAVVIATVNFPTVTNDKLLIAVFGGFFLGLGIGLSIRGGGVLDGTEVLAIYIAKKSGLTIGDIITIANVIIFFAAAFVFKIETALYAMITYLAASKTVDFVVDGIEEFIGVTIISKKTEEIRKVIVQKVGRGCTIYKGKGGYPEDSDSDNNKDIDILYTLITRLELAQLQTQIDIIDTKAFIVMHSVKDAKGGMIKKRIHK